VIPLPAVRIVTAPQGGRVVSVLEPDTLVRAGDVVAVLDVPRGRLPLRARESGRVGGAMVRATELAAEGEGVLWLAR